MQFGKGQRCGLKEVKRAAVVIRDGVQGSGMGTGPLLLTMAPGWLSVNSGTAHDVEIGWICTEQSRYQPGFGNA